MIVTAFVIDRVTIYKTLLTGDNAWTQFYIFDGREVAISYQKSEIRRQMIGHSFIFLTVEKLQSEGRRSMPVKYFF